MKRFFLLSSIAIVLTILICIISNSLLYFAAFFFIILLFSSILIYKFKRTYIKSIVSFMLISIFMFIYVEHYLNQKDALNKLVGETEIFNCTLVEEPVNQGNYYTYIVKPDKGAFDEINFEFKIKLNCSFNVGVDAYDKLKVCAEFKELKEEGKLRSNSDGIMLTGKLKFCSYKIVNHKPLFSVVKGRIIKAFSEAGEGDIVGIPIAILTGDKSFLSNGFYSDIKTTGMAHVMAVSGFHISVICMNIVLIMRKLKFGRKNAAVVGLLLLILLMGVAGFTGSVLRASLMYVIMFIGELVSRRPDPLNSLGFAITVLCIINPYSIFSVSLQLSTFGTLGILLLTPPLNEAFIDNIKLRGKLRKAFNSVAQIFTVSFSAGLFVMPISLFTFGYVSIISVIVNLFITIPVYFNIFSSIFYVILCEVPYLSKVILFITNTSSQLFKLIIEFFADFNLAVFRVDDIMLYSILFLSVSFSIFVIKFKRKTVYVYLSLLMSLVLLTTSLAVQNVINAKTTTITYFPTSNGHLVSLESYDKNILISSTTDRYALNEAYFHFYENLDQSIDVLLIASDDVDVLENTITLTEQLDIKDINLCKNTKSLTLNDAELIIVKKNEFYDLLIYLSEETITIDNSGTAAYKTDYILTRNPILSHKLNGKHSKLIINGEVNPSVEASDYLSNKGVKTAVLSDFGTITSKKIGNNLLNFKR